MFPHETSAELKVALATLAAGNLAKGAEIVRVAANGGDPEAMSVMGNLYLHGVGVERSVKYALEFYNKAIELKYPPAMITLSRMYAHGNGVASDPSKTVELCEMAGAHGDPGAYTVLGLLFENNKYGIVRDPQKAKDYMQKAVDGHDPDGLFHLSRYYLAGTGVQKDVAKGFSLCEAAAEAESPDGLFGLAFLYLTGFEGHTQDVSRAYSLYRKAARLGHADARAELKNFPEVVKLGNIACSPGVANTLQQPDLAELISRHKSGNWGDVDPVEWDKNDEALARGGDVRSIHDSQYYTVILQTEGNRSSTYVEFLNEDFSNQPIDYLESAERALRLFKLMNGIFDFIK